MNTHAAFLNKDDCLLLVVDIQDGMLKTCVNIELLKQRIAALMDIADLMDIPVILTEHNPDKLGVFLPEFVSRAKNPRVFQKIAFSCLADSEISGAIAETGRKTIILSGIETHICIFQTGAHALLSGYNLHLISDAVTSRSRISCEIGIRRLCRAGAVISSTEMMIFELLGRAGTSEFRKALPVIKEL